MNFVKRITVLFAITMMLGLSASAQHKEVTRSTNGWFMLMNQLRLNEGWSLSNELHIRRADVYERWQQFLLRPALNYHINPNVELSVGYTYIKNYPYGEQPVKMKAAENNIWQQLLLKQAIGKVGILHRYRLEERFVDRVRQVNDGQYEINGTDYRQRFRYRITANIPLLQFTEQKVLFASVFDELWVNLENDFMLSSFNQNWFYAGLGYQFNKMGNLQAGYLNQVIHKGDGVHYEINPTISVALFYNFDMKQQ